MGVHGLWRLIEPSGKPVPLETLENKVLAVDISIWLHQAVKGFQDSRGAPIPNAHLLGIYHRVCKLLYFRIKPIFVFDGGVPALKKQTIAKRTQSKLRNVAEADRIQRQLLSTLLKHTAVSKVLTEKIEASLGTVNKVVTKQKKDDLYVLPSNNELDSTFSSSEDESQSESTTADSSPSKNWDLHTIDMESNRFKSLPIDVRHEILTDLKETRKQSSWGRLHELPKISDDFSVYQLNRLRKRQAVQAALEEAEKEMGGKSLSMAELESILKDQGVINNQNVGTRIASDETTKYLLVKDVKKAMEEAKQNELESKSKMIEDTKEISVDTKPNKTQADVEYEEDLERAIALSLECEPSTSEPPDKPSTSKIITTKTNPAEFSFLDNFTDADFAESSSDEEPLAIKVAESRMSSAKSYMVEYSGLTPTEIARIMNNKSSASNLNQPQSKKSVLHVLNENKVEISPSKIELDKKNYAGKEPDKNDATTRYNTVEIMSSTDSSDSESVDQQAKKVIDIVINPNQQFEEGDDLFSDIFDDIDTPLQSIDKNSKDSQTSINLPLKPVNIVINTNQEKNIIDDLFNNTFSKTNDGIKIHTNTGQVSKSENEKKKNELLANVIQPSEQFSKEDDLFSDICVEQKGESKLDTEENVTVPDVELSSNMIAENHNIKVVENKSQIIDMNKIVEDQQDKHENKKNSGLIQKREKTEVTDTEKVSESSHNLVANSENPKGPAKTDKGGMTEEELLKLKNTLQRERIDLLNEKSSKERIAGNITDQMYQEAQELLELFGVPYIIAPMEAEAQCAFLDAIELTDGTITDDSDIWLFGGKTVYKNFFNQSKYVMEFRADSIQHHFKLTREQMILLALLVGSDYTSGLQGVGPVTAVEILSAFPPSKGRINEFSLSHADLLSGLKEFRSWFSKGKSPGPGRNALKSKLKNLSFTENFPSLQVVEAYLEPKVETSREAFSWGKPNSQALIEFAREKFGWTRNKSEDIINPVIKRLEEGRHQKSIKDYFKTHFKLHSGEAESKMSKRVKSAITNMGRDPSEIIAEELEEELKKDSKKKRAPRRKKDGLEAPEFSKKTRSSKNNDKNVSGNLVQQDKDDESDKDFTQSTNDRNLRKKDKVHLRKLKSKPETVDNQLAGSSKTTENTYVILEENNPEDEVDISEKIDHIRKRRKLKEAKEAVEIKKPKLPKEKSKLAKEKIKNVVSQFEEPIPESLKADEEVTLLSQIAVQSSLKVDAINKNLQDQLENLRGKSVKISKPSGATPSGPSVSQPSQSVQRPLNRPTRIPRKEVIPQKEKDKTAVLRNKLKAIEVFRKGKLGPGYVPKKDRKKRVPKAEAELSESSD